MKTNVFVLLIMAQMKKEERKVYPTTEQIINLFTQSKTCSRLLIRLINSDEAMPSASRCACCLNFNEKENLKMTAK